MNYSEKEIDKALAYHKTLKVQGLLSPDIEARATSAFTHASMFDIETYDLYPKSPIYEAAVVHGVENPSIKHTFVNAQGGEISKFTADQFLKRQAGMSPWLQDALAAATTTQEQVAQLALDELKGRDVWVQNLPFERSFVKERTTREQFNAWAVDSRLESYTPGSGLYTTSPNIKKALTHAGAGQTTSNSIDEYLGRWSSVFDEFEHTLESKRPSNVTRIFDVQDLTRSVFALAQKNNVMGKTGELFSGTSIDTLSKAIFGLEEHHTAAGNSVLQGPIAKFLYGTGLAIKQGKGLTDRQKSFFHHVAASQKVAKQQGAVKNIIETYKAQQKYLSIADDRTIPQKAKIDVLSRARTDFSSEARPINLQVLDHASDTYSREAATYIAR